MSFALPMEVSRARIQLMLRYTYLASATARLRFVMSTDGWCHTMATDGYNIFISNEFVQTLTEDEVIGVLAHEVMHCVLGHIDRRGSRNQEIWNIAIDFATNLMLFDAGVNLPRTGLLDRAYRGMTAEDIYSRLKALSKAELDKRFGRIELNRESGDRSNTRNGFADIHLGVDDVRGQWARGDEYPTEYERVRLRRSWREELKSKIPGTLSGSNAEEIERAAHQQINWRDYFSRFVTGLRRDDYRLFPPNKKHIWRQVYLPSFGSPGPDHLVIVIDTSGSMDPMILGKIIAEIDAARQLCECGLTILQCDMVIKDVRTYEPWELWNEEFRTMRIRGRGGTSFEAPFKWVDELVLSGHPVPDALIYMTDGFGVFPRSPPGYPCLWIVPESGSEKFPFGEVVRVSTQE
jgi:predicted metal-dependent peptidase